MPFVTHTFPGNAEEQSGTQQAGRQMVSPPATPRHWRVVAANGAPELVVNCLEQELNDVWQQLCEASPDEALSLKLQKHISTHAIGYILNANQRAIVPGPLRRTITNFLRRIESPSPLGLRSPLTRVASLRLLPTDTSLSNPRTVVLLFLNSEEFQRYSETRDKEGANSLQSGKGVQEEQKQKSINSRSIVQVSPRAALNAFAESIINDPVEAEDLPRTSPVEWSIVRDFMRRQNDQAPQLAGKEIAGANSPFAGAPLPAIAVGQGSGESIPEAPAASPLADMSYTSPTVRLDFTAIAKLSPEEFFSWFDKQYSLPPKPALISAMQVWLDNQSGSHWDLDVPAKISELRERLNLLKKGLTCQASGPHGNICGHRAHLFFDAKRKTNDRPDGTYRFAHADKDSDKHGLWGTIPTLKIFHDEQEQVEESQ